MAIFPESLLTLFDGQRIMARRIKEGDVLLGSDQDGLLAPAVVQSIKKTDLISPWHNVRTKRHETALGNSFFSLHLSPGHPIYVDLNKTITPENVYPGDFLQGMRSTLNLDLVQKSILLGILLGDGSISRASAEGGSCSVRWAHSEKQEEYMKWTVSILGSLAKLGKDDRSGYGSRMLTARTGFHPDISNLFAGFDKPNGEIPASVAEMLNPISLALWYMDDGSLTHTEGHHDRASFSTYSFSDNSIEILRNGLLRMGINSTIQNSEKGKTIRLNYQAARLMFTIIAALVPPSMQYKLPQDLRGGPGWMPQPQSVPGYRNTPLEVISNDVTILKNKVARKSGLEIFTSTGNVYANNVLVRA